MRWYLRYSLSLREVEELFAERRLEADHTTICRWVLYVRLAAALNDKALIIFHRPVHDLAELGAGDVGIDAASHFISNASIEIIRE